MTPPTASMPRALYALSTGAATLAGVAIGVALASRAGGEGMALGAIAACVLGFGALCFVALMGPPLVTPDRFGIVVFGVSGVRTMAVLGAMLLLIEVGGLAKAPVVHGLLGGVLPIMVAEALAAAWLIHRRDNAGVPGGASVRRSV